MTTKMAEGDDREDSDANPKDFVGDNEEIPSIESVQISAEDEIDEFEEDEEYMALDNQLDQLNACLNDLEARNDDLVTKLKALLADSKEVQRELQELNGRSDGTPPDSGQGASGSGVTS